MEEGEFEQQSFDEFGLGEHLGEQNEKKITTEERPKSKGVSKIERYSNNLVPFSDALKADHEKVKEYPSKKNLVVVPRGALIKFCGSDEENIYPIKKGKNVSPMGIYFLEDPVLAVRVEIIPKSEIRDAGDKSLLCFILNLKSGSPFVRAKVDKYGDEVTTKHPGLFVSDKGIRQLPPEQLETLLKKYGGLESLIKSWEDNQPYTRHPGHTD